MVISMGNMTIHQWIWGHVQQYSSQRQRNGGYLYGTMYHQEIYQPRILGGYNVSKTCRDHDFFLKQQTWGFLYINQFLGLPVSGDIDQWSW